MVRWLLIAGLGLVVAGCGVSKQVVAQKDAQLQACVAAREASTKDAEGLKAELARAQRDLGACSNRLTACEGARDQAASGRQSAEEAMKAFERDLATARGEVDTLRRRESDLRDRLQKEIGSCQVEVERLKDRLTVRVLDQVLFPSGSASIGSQGKAVLDKVATALAAGDERIRVEGHTDAVPIGKTLKDRYPSNWELSAARGAAVVRYFQYARGIDPERMEVAGLAATRPLGANDTDEGRAKNRRVQIVVTPAP